MKSEFTGEILHFNAVRLRVNGIGLLRMTLESLDNVNTYSLPVVSLSSLNAREPTTLSNFISQRGSLKIETIAIDEYFSISKINIYVKPVAAQFPQ